MAAALVTLASAKIHLRRDDVTTDDVAIQLKLDQAEAEILEYLDTAADPLWISPATAPGAVTDAILLLTEHLFVNRGADLSMDEDCWAAITRRLGRLKISAIA